jgi:hypothetical protein
MLLPIGAAPLSGPLPFGPISHHFFPLALDVLHCLCYRIFAGPTAAIAASAITLAGISIDCAAATFQSMEVGYQLSAYLVTSPASFGIGPATHQVHRRTFQGDSEDGTR